MTVRTVGEMVHGHTFDAMVPYFESDALCMAASEDAPNHICARPYNEHATRPPLSRTAVDKEPGVLDRFGFRAAHKYGCGAITEVAGVCNCFMLDWNVGMLVSLAQAQLGRYEDFFRPGNLAVDQMSSSDFRLAYAGLEQVTDVTVNGRPIGRWTPVERGLPEVRTDG